MLPPEQLRFLAGYPEPVLVQVRALIAKGGLAAHLAKKYPDAPIVKTDSALNDYVQALKKQELKSAPPIHKVQFENKLDVIQNALGTHTTVRRIQGGRIKTKSEIRVAGLFRELAPEFLEMIVVHELAHLKEAEHNKAFYRLCEHMLPDYYQREFDLRLLLTQRALG